MHFFELEKSIKKLLSICCRMSSSYSLIDSNTWTSLSPLQLVITPVAVNWEEFNC